MSSIKIHIFSSELWCAFSLHVEKTPVFLYELRSSICLPIQKLSNIVDDEDT